MGEINGYWEGLSKHLPNPQAITWSDANKFLPIKKLSLCNTEGLFPNHFFGGGGVWA